MDAEAQSAGTLELFRRNGLRRTRQRELVYHELLASKSHPTAEELFDAVRARDRRLSLATVYNTLDVLVERGLARRVPALCSGPSRFDADLSHHAHVTTGDGRVVDLPEDLSKRLLGAVDARVVREIESRLGVRVARVSVQVVADDTPTP
jgi:Fe2+ or Zn2+ uptake regulation protein